MALETLRRGRRAALTALALATAMILLPTPAKAADLAVEFDRPGAGAVLPPNFPIHLKVTHGPASKAILSVDGGDPVSCELLTGLEYELWSCTLPTPLDEGAHTLQGTVTNAAGVTAMTVLQPITVDSPPNPTIPSPITTGPLSEVTEVSGQVLWADDGVKVTLSVDGAEPTECTVTGDQFVCPLARPLSAGEHDLAVEAVDSLGIATHDVITVTIVGSSPTPQPSTSPTPTPSKPGLPDTGL